MREAIQEGKLGQIQQQERWFLEQHKQLLMQKEKLLKEQRPSNFHPPASHSSPCKPNSNTTNHSPAQVLTLGGSASSNASHSTTTTAATRPWPPADRTPATRSQLNPLARTEQSESDDDEAHPEDD